MLRTTALALGLDVLKARVKMSSNMSRDGLIPSIKAIKVVVVRYDMLVQRASWVRTTIWETSRIIRVTNAWQQYRFGKSAIAQTIAERCATASTLTASFFFSRGAGPRARIAGLIPTLAYQLTLSVPDTKPLIHDALQGDPTIPYQSLED
jgi:hypothetical protein